ncbi:MAG: helix-turn-helix domain-containing protein [Prevotella sp.]
MKRILLLTYTLLLVLATHAGEESEFQLYKKWHGLESETLFEMGRGYLYDSVPDAHKALLCYTIVLNRYDESMPANKKQLCAMAYNGAGYVYFYHFYDYAKAYAYFSQSIKISEEIGFKGGLINGYQCLANVFMTFAAQNDELRSINKGIELYRKSFNIAVKERHFEGVISNFINMTSVAFSMGNLSLIEPELDTFSRLKFPKGVANADYATYIYRSMMAVRDSDFVKAMHYFDLQIAEAARGGAVSKERMMMNPMFNKAITYSLIKDYEKATAELKKIESISRRHDLKDQLSSVYHYLAEMYKHVDKTEADRYRYQYLELRDTLQQENNLQEVAELHFLDEFQKIDNEMQRMESRRRMWNIIMVSLSIGGVILSVFLVLLYRKNKQLWHSNRELYQKNVALLKRDEEERSNNEKYSNSSLDNEDKEQLFQKIRNVFADTSTFCSEDFSLDRLAQLVDSKPKYVSQVINELYGKTFTNLLTEVRIKEVCKRLSDVENYGNYTIEAVAAGVGFKSRANFTTNFKRFTGLTPSAYQKIAKSPEN